MSAELHVARSITVQGEEIPVPISLADMAWMAGIIDLKGVMIRKNNQTRRTPQYVLYVQTKVRRVAERLSALSGTAPEEHSAPAPGEFMRRNCAEHCTSPHVHVSQSYPWNMPLTTRWALTGIAAAIVLANLAPFMSTYKDYADDVAVILRDFAAGGHGSGAVRKTIARLSALGWQIPAEVTVKLAAALGDKEEDEWALCAATPGRHPGLTTCITARKGSSTGASRMSAISLSATRQGRRTHDTGREDRGAHP